jgi:hypothetical protein
MSRATTRLTLLLAVLGFGAWAFMAAYAADPQAKNDSTATDTAKPREKPTDTGKSAGSDSAPAVKPKPISPNVQKGLDYLIEMQDASGGWGQGGGWRQSSSQGGRVEGNDAKDRPDLGNTCIATLALIRAGNTPHEGKYAKNVARAVAFICDRVEGADKDSLYVTDVRDTQLQVKIGPYVDTFLAGLVLSELKGKIPADGTDKRLVAALDKTISKIEKNQKSDGTFAGNGGWASVLSLGLNSKFINRAAQNGVTVKAEVLAKDFNGTVAGLDKASGEFKSAAALAVSAPAAGVGGPGPGTKVASGDVEKTAGAETSGFVDGHAGGMVGGLVVRGSSGAAFSDAGVKLYNSASNASRLSDLGNTSALMEMEAKKIISNASSTAEEKTKARDQLAKVAEIKDAQQVSINGIIRQLDDKQFIAGFGNNGGEEFLSYMNISEMLVVKGGAEWRSWDKSIGDNLVRVQNKDGSWSGDHCITGRTFCTSAALLTLLADRAPVPLAAKIQNNEPVVQSGSAEKAAQTPPADK